MNGEKGIKIITGRTELGILITIRRSLITNKKENLLAQVLVLELSMATLISL